MGSQYWFRWRFGAVSQQDITGVNVDPDLCHHMASLDHIELSTKILKCGIKNENRTSKLGYKIGHHWLRFVGLGGRLTKPWAKWTYIIEYLQWRHGPVPHPVQVKIMMTSSKWKHFPRYWPFVRGIHRSRWIPHTKASDAELWWFLWSAPEYTMGPWGWWFETPSWSLWRHCNANEIKGQWWWKHFRVVTPWWNHRSILINAYLMRIRLFANSTNRLRREGLRVICSWVELFITGQKGYRFVCYYR